MSRITEMIHADKDRFDDHSDTTQQDVHGAMLERIGQPQNPSLPERKVRKFSLSLSLSLIHTRREGIPPTGVGTQGPASRGSRHGQVHRVGSHRCSQSSVTPPRSRPRLDCSNQRFIWNLMHLKNLSRSTILVSQSAIMSGSSTKIISILLFM